MANRTFESDRNKNHQGITLRKTARVRQSGGSSKDKDGSYAGRKLSASPNGISGIAQLCTVGLDVVAIGGQ